MLKRKREDEVIVNKRIHTPNINQLPDIPLLHIFSYIIRGGKTTVNIPLVCRKWDILYSESLKCELTKFTSFLHGKDGLSKLVTCIIYDVIQNYGGRFVCSHLKEFNNYNKLKDFRFGIYPIYLKRWFFILLKRTLESIKSIASDLDINPVFNDNGFSYADSKRAIEQIENSLLYGSIDGSMILNLTMDQQQIESIYRLILDDKLRAIDNVIDLCPGIPIHIKLFLTSLAGSGDFTISRLYMLRCNSLVWTEMEISLEKFKWLETYWNDEMKKWVYLFLRPFNLFFPMW